MALGPGKYDDLATYVRKQAAAKAVVVIVVGGTKGAGFSVQATADTVLALPQLLRTVAEGLEEGEGSA